MRGVKFREGFFSKCGRGDHNYLVEGETLGDNLEYFVREVLKTLGMKGLDNLAVELGSLIGYFGNMEVEFGRREGRLVI